MWVQGFRFRASRSKGLGFKVQGLASGVLHGSSGGVHRGSMRVLELPLRIIVGSFHHRSTEPG